MLRLLLGFEMEKLASWYSHSAVGHKWHHIQSTIDDAKKFCEIIGTDYTIELEIAILFHDISLAFGGDRENHEVESAEKFREFVKAGEFPSLELATDEEIQDIMNIIMSHRSSKTAKNQHTDIRYVVMGMADRGFPAESKTEFVKLKFNKLLECFAGRENAVQFTCDYCRKKYGKHGYGYNVFYSDLFTPEVQAWIDEMVKKQRSFAERTADRVEQMYKEYGSLPSSILLADYDFNFGSKDRALMLESMSGLYVGYTGSILNTRDFYHLLIMKRHLYKVWVSTTNHGLVTGFIIFNKASKKEGVIELLIVNEHFRGKKQRFSSKDEDGKYSEALMKRVINFAISKKFEKITLYRDANVKSLRKFYKNFGFKQVGRRGKASVKMTLDLTDYIK